MIFAMSVKCKAKCIARPRRLRDSGALKCSNAVLVYYCNARLACHHELRKVAWLHASIQIPSLVRLVSLWNNGDESFLGSTFT